MRCEIHNRRERLSVRTIQTNYSKFRIDRLGLDLRVSVTVHIHVLRCRFDAILMNRLAGRHNGMGYFLLDFHCECHCVIELAFAFAT